MAPLVSIGVPIYNGARTIRRALESALGQTYRDVEVVISDNASTDATAEICQQLAASDPRVRYYRQAANVGPVENFRAVLRDARGELFMWLGDDDWLDPRYVEACAAVLASDPSAAIVSGRAQYYRGDVQIRHGRTFSVTADDPLRRVITYLRDVKDNGVFYGLMRRTEVPGTAVPPVLAGDWLLVASLAYRGKLISLDDVVVHRDLGGTSQNLAHLVSVLGVPAWNARFPAGAKMLSAFRYFLQSPGISSPWQRLALSSSAACTIGYRESRRFTKLSLRALRERVTGRSNARRRKPA